MLWGVILGSAFPLFAFLLCIFVLTPDDASPSLLSIHRDFPLLWIVDTAPLVLAIVAYVVGTNVKKASLNFAMAIESAHEQLLEQNKQLQSYLEEKEVLLKEVHHRVKNNLQVITSLLSLQTGFIDDEKAKALFRYSQYRINSMALIHEMLYHSQDISQIDYRDYVDKLTNSLLVSMKGNDNNITLDLQVPELTLNLDTAIPLGLLINEIITNSLKYAFPGDEEGHIHLHLKRTGGSRFLMHIGDDGIGFKDGIEFRSATSLGLILIHKLILQLKGNIEKNNNAQGTNYIAEFEEIFPA